MRSVIWPIWKIRTVVNLLATCNHNMLPNWSRKRKESSYQELELLYNKTPGHKGRFHQYNNQLVNLLVPFKMIYNHLIYSFFLLPTWRIRVLSVLLVCISSLGEKNQSKRCLKYATHGQYKSWWLCMVMCVHINVVTWGNQ